MRCAMGSQSWLRKTRRVMAIFLACLMVVSILPFSSVSSQAAQSGRRARYQKLLALRKEAKQQKKEKEEAQEVLYIRTASDLVSLSQKSHLNIWSKNTKVELLNDVSLHGSNFDPISSFAGVFEGNGFTISEFDYQGIGYSDGFFRYVEKSGVVRNLTIKGNLTSQAEEKLLGGIAGANAGTIENCSFIGTVDGKEMIGGIVGRNESTGTIKKCQSDGRIIGNYSVGGIAGENIGVITDCTNYAGVDDTNAWINKTEQESNVNNLESILKGNTNATMDIGKDIGGIAGLSKGMISSCSNGGIVGYEHTGYNVGGIAGRQSGVVSHCTNEGSVYGRRDVAGIVGQAEPDIMVDEAESLASEVQDLHDMVDKMLDDMEETSDVVSADFDELQKYADQAADEADSLADQATNFVDSNIDSVNDLSARVEYIVDHLPSVMDNAGSALDVLDIVSDDIKEINDDFKQISSIIDAMDEVTSDAQDVNDDLETSSDIMDKFDEILTDLENVNNDLSGINEVTSDLMDVNQDMKKINNDLGGLSTVMKKFNDLSNDISLLGDHLNIYNQMKNSSYKEAEYKRLTFTTGVGGTMGSANNTNPAEGEKVTFVVAPANGYAIKTGYPQARDAKGANVPLTVTKSSISVSGSGITYEMTMPAENVVVTAQFDYIGEYLAASNPGGKVYISENSSSGAVTVRIRPEAGYQVEKLTIGDKEYDRLTEKQRLGDENVKFSRKNPNYGITDGKPKVVYAAFGKREGYHEIEALSYSGGSYKETVSSAAIKGETVTVVLQADLGYSISGSGLTVKEKNGSVTKGGPAGSRAEKYTFVMPDQDVTLWGSYKKNETTKARLYTDSVNEGGKVSFGYSADEEAGTVECTVTITPDSRYGYSYKSGSLKIENYSEYPGIKKLEEIKPTDDDLQSGLNGVKVYRFQMENNQYGKVSVAFEKVRGTYTVTTHSGTGGTLMTESQTISKGALVTLVAAPAAGYYFDGIKVYNKNTKKEVDKDAIKKENSNVYTLTMPNYDVEVEAEFKPVMLYLTSTNNGGNATYVADTDEITVTVRPESGYGVKKNPTLVDSKGKTVAYQKKYANSDVYTFTLNDSVSQPAHFEVTFEKLSNYDSVKSAKDQIQESSDTLNNDMTKAQDALANIRKIMIDEDGNARQISDLSDAERTEVITNLLDASSALGEAGTSASTIVTQVSTISRIMSPYLESTMKNVNDDVKRISDDMRAINKQMTQIINDTNGDVNTLLDDLGKTTQKIGDISAGVNRDMNSAIKHAKEMSSLLSDMLESANADIDRALSALKAVGTLSKNFVDDFTEDTDKTLDDFDSMMEYVHAAGDNASDIVDYLNTLDSIRFEKLGDDFSDTCDNLYDEMKSISRTLEKINDNLSHYTDVLVDDFRDINDQLNKILIDLIERSEDAAKLQAEGSLYEDVTLKQIDKVRLGKVKTSVNSGIIKGDVDVGGIIGEMGVDDTDVTESSASDVDFEVGNKYLTKCLVENCTNRGFITSKQNYAGGIAGNMKIGVIKGCESYGTAESKEGSYVGGVVGQSKAAVFQCSAMSRVSGSKYVGGIAGYGETIRRCYSMSKVSSEEGRQGAIAGQISYVDDDKIKRRSKQVSKNYYVSDELFGIDEISYVGVAEPLTYAEMLAKKNVPYDFNHLTITFRVEDEVVDVQEYAYGTNLALVKYPEIPKKEDTYGEWPNLIGQTMKTNLVIEAEYYDDVKVLESVERAQDSNCYAMVEGLFTENHVLHAIQKEMEVPSEAKKTGDYRTEEVIIIGNTVAGIGSPDEKLTNEDSIPVRLYNEYGEGTKVFRYQDEKWEELDALSRGSYLQVTMQGNREIFCVVAGEKTNKWLYIGIGAGVVVVLAAFILIGKGCKKRKKSKQG